MASPPPPTATAEQLLSCFPCVGIQDVQMSLFHSLPFLKPAYPPTMVHSPRVPDRGALHHSIRNMPGNLPTPTPRPFCISIKNILISKATSSTTTWPIFSSVLKSRASPNPNLPEAPACSDLLTGGDWVVGMTGVLWGRVRSHRSHGSPHLQSKRSKWKPLPRQLHFPSAYCVHSFFGGGRAKQ